MPDLQSFSVPRGNSMDVVVALSSDFIVDSLEGATITWKVYEQKHGVRTQDVDAVITKVSSEVTQMEVPPSGLTFTIFLKPEDTVDLELGNYYHEVTVEDEEGEIVTTTQGLMTITETEN